MPAFKSDVQPYEKLGRYLPREIVHYETAIFIGHYSPCHVDVDIFQDCLNSLCYGQDPVMTRSNHGSYVWEDLPEEREPEVLTFLQKIIGNIGSYARETQMHIKPQRLDIPLPSIIPYSNYSLDACLVDADWNTNSTLVTHSNKNEFTLAHVIAPLSLKNYECVEVIDVREQIFAACHHILNEDPRRKWIYAFSVEGDYMVLWYFSRSHSVKAAPFNWKQNPNVFVEVWLNFVTASSEQLGFDPLVHKIPDEDAYIYEIGGDELAPDSSSSQQKVYYRTVQSLHHGSPIGFAGRATRVWKVAQIRSLSDPSPIIPDNFNVLKDVWVDVGTRTEDEIQDEFFNSVDNFVAGNWKHDKRLQDFDKPIMDRLEYLFTDKKYRDLFLTKVHAWSGETCKAVVDSTYHCRGPFDNDYPFNSKTTVTIGAKFTQKRQMRIVYKEVCASLGDLPTLGDVMDILRQTLDALQVLFCAGWVHRDISSGNILAYQISGSNDSGWRVKLSDFEFARPQQYSDDTSASITGTPYFMPWEVMKQRYLIINIYDPTSHDETFADQLHLPEGEKNPNYERFTAFKRFHAKRIASMPPDSTPHIPATNGAVTYNFQHDIESVWWIALYFAMAAVGHLPSIKYAAAIFQDQMTDDRSSVLTLNIQHTLAMVLHPTLLAAFPEAMDSLRNELYIQHVTRALFGLLDPPESYSSIHRFFASQFSVMLDTNKGGWRNIALVPLDKLRSATNDECGVKRSPESPFYSNKKPRLDKSDNRLEI